MKSSRAKGCLLGGLFGLVVFLVLIAVSHDVPDFGGLLFVPLFVLFFGLIGMGVGWLVGTPASMPKPTLADTRVWIKGCGLALLLSALIALFLGALSRYFLPT